VASSFITKQIEIHTPNGIRTHNLVGWAKDAYNMACQEGKFELLTFLTSDGQVSDGQVSGSHIDATLTFWHRSFTFKF
jgi:hypothetical protein